MEIKGNIPEKTIREIFPNAIKTDLYTLLEMTYKGVYFSETGTQFYKIRMIGPCPNLDKDSVCQIYPERPVACKRLVIGDDYCRKARATDGLLSIELAHQTSVL